MERQPLGVEQEETPHKKVFWVREILGESKEVIIKHGPEEYRLRLTSNQKLILTK